MSVPSIDLNADMGEGAAGDEDLLGVVTSASVACGFHAGGADVMLETALRAAQRGVALGAHPSYPDREYFGRQAMCLAPEELLAVIVYQVGAMAAIAASAGAPLRFVKPHGALYNQASVDPAVAEIVVDAVWRASDPAQRLGLLCPSGSQMEVRARSMGLPVFAEAFADRSYRPDGTLVSRSEPGSVLGDPATVVAQAVELALRQRVRAVDGTMIPVTAQSICLHGDTAGAASLATAVRGGLESAGVSITSFAPA